jgi:cell division protein FtsL
MDYKQKNIIRFLCIAGVTLTFILVVVLLYQFIKIGNQNKELNRLEGQLLQVTQQTEDYDSIVQNMQDVNYLEDYARESGWAQNGDIKFN